MLDRFPGGAIVDTRYEPPFDRLPDHGPKGHTVLAAEHVVLDKGTGLVHTAMAFGEEDFVLCERHGIPLVNPVREDGTYDERITGYEGVFVGDATPRVVAELHEAGKLWDTEPYVHSYPALLALRLEAPLLREGVVVHRHARPPPRHARAEPADRLAPRARARRALRQLAAGQRRLGSVPRPLLGHAAADLGVRRCDARHCIGSLAELREVAGALPQDLHRPFIDDVSWGCTVAGCDGAMHRVRATIDTWYDSACMPFAQFHYPFEGKREVAEQFPPTFICEGIDQTRGWFYTSLAVSTLLFRDIPFRHAVCVGHVTDAKGHKMSKSRGNAVDPWEVLNTHGADAFRWYYLASQQPWAGYRFSADAVHEGMRELLLPLWTTYGFYVLYANIEALRRVRARRRSSERPALDRWAISKLQALTERMRTRIDDFDATTAVRLAAEWVEDLSNWYIRLSRRRFWEGDVAALATLRECLVETAKLLAPPVPFLAEEIYSNLVGGAAADFGAEPDSVHLCDYPEPVAALRDVQLEEDMALVARGDRAGPRRAREIEGEGAPAAAARRRVRRCAGRGRGRPAARAGAERAEREGGRGRGAGRRAGAAGRAAEPAETRAALRQGHAAGGRRAALARRRGGAAGRCTTTACSRSRSRPATSSTRRTRTRWRRTTSSCGASRATGWCCRRATA